MDKYDNMIIQKSIKQELKIKSLYIIDLAIVIGPTFIIIYLQNMLGYKVLTAVLLSVLSFFLGLFLCAKPASNGGRRNLYTIYCLLTMDRSIYEVQSYQSKVTKGDVKNADDYL